MMSVKMPRLIYTWKDVKISGRTLRIERFSKFRKLIKMIFIFIWKRPNSINQKNMLVNTTLRIRSWSITSMMTTIKTKTSSKCSRKAKPSSSPMIDSWWSVANQKLAIQREKHSRLPSNSLRILPSKPRLMITTKCSGINAWIYTKISWVISEFTLTINSTNSWMRIRLTAHMTWSSCPFTRSWSWNSSSKSLTSDWFKYSTDKRSSLVKRRCALWSHHFCSPKWYLISSTSIKLWW